ncbi:L,D-transpeptidase [Microlunatus flavus]|uniref:Lipoprotein-anchoring transpeptidase ErfK/SrfK n=1 Tax=Microlunatus flavus TaxID=1036181 RepID=A0A1H9K944_9ACTN|nr:Ig-like domain-containing protein [Microlunatus flavus]SEQ95433.1 Lipoprotein-anchoring transpeptidase ErfK/SrfK [Microlunatus flavus]
MPTRRHLAAGGLASAVLLLAVSAGCGTVPDAQGSTGGQSPAPTTSQPTTSPSPSATPTTPAVKLSSNVDDGDDGVKVSTLVTAKASQGKLSAVDLDYKYTDTKGKAQKGTLKGSMNKAKTSWTAGDRLEPSGTYTLTVTGKNSAGDKTTQKTKFETQDLALSNQVFPELYPLPDSKVGVGMPAIVRFDTPVADKKSFEKNLHITTVPKQTGSWHWYGSQEVHWRPKSYWKPGTKVKVEADVNGVPAGNGRYGQKSSSTNFTVGRKFVIKVNLKSDYATVYKNDKKVRSIPVTGGKPGWVTRSGTKLIMAKEYNKVMTNEQIGAKEKYKLTAAYAMRITNSGEFLHSAPWSTGSQGVANVSHGCTGMSVANSRYLIENTLIGDPVVTTGTNRGIEPGNGYTDWNASYSEYKKGSAL